MKLFLHEGVILVILFSLNKQFQGELVVFGQSCDLADCGGYLTFYVQCETAAAPQHSVKVNSQQPV